MFPVIFFAHNPSDSKCELWNEVLFRIIDIHKVNSRMIIYNKYFPDYLAECDIYTQYFPDYLSETKSESVSPLPTVADRCLRQHIYNSKSDFNVDESLVEMYGTVAECLPNTTFQIQLDNGFTIFCYLSGKLRRHNIRVLLGDYVRVEMSPYDLKKGRIVFRMRRALKSTLP